MENNEIKKENIKRKLINFLIGFIDLSLAVYLIYNLIVMIVK